MRASASFGALGVIAAIVCALAAQPAAAQEADEAAVSDAPPPATVSDDAQPPADAPLTPEESATLGQALLFDPAAVGDGKPVRRLRLPSLTGADPVAVSHADKPDGSRTLVLKQSLATDWDAKVGADLNLSAPPADGYRSGKPLAASAGEDTGAAWASVGLPDLASLDARVDPANDRGKLATTFKRSIPVGGTVSVTLQDSYTVTDTFSTSPTTPSDLPLMTAPAATSSTPTQVWDSRKSVKFDILSTGTTLGAALTTASNDPVAHNTLSATQKLYGPLHLATAVSDVGQAHSNKSLSASLKLTW